jgi:ssDNA-binding Zn-finger/Zn-ribbon topoisomerase 1
MVDEQNQPETQQQCPRCGTAFTCGLQAGHETCWCFAFPHLITIENSSRKGCLCPNCFKQVIEEIQHSQDDGSQAGE